MSDAFKKHGSVKECILVCISYGPNADKLIQRGHQLAKMQKCSLIVLTVLSEPVEKFNMGQSQIISEWESMCWDLDAVFVMRESRNDPVYRVIAHVAREYEATQILLGQTAKSVWQHVTQGSIINDLLKELPFIDLHIVSVPRQQRPDEDKYDEGVRAYLKKTDTGYELTFTYEQGIVHEGIYYQSLYTDFDNGIFKMMKEGELIECKVHKGKVEGELIR